MMYDKEIKIAKQLAATGLSEREAKDILSHTGDFGFIEIHAAHLILGENHPTKRYKTIRKGVI